MSAVGRRALYALGGLTGLGVTVDLRPDVGLMICSPLFRLATGTSISSDKVLAINQSGILLDKNVMIL